MVDITQSAGTWSFDGDTLRIVPGNGKHIAPLRRALGEVSVPLEAIAGIAYEAGRKGGRLRLRLRHGADALAQVASGRLPDAADPYQLAVESDRSGVAEYLVEEVRRVLLLEQVPDTPCERYLMPGPSVPLTASGTDGTASFDGERVHIEWNWMAEESKSSGGPRTFTLDELAGVEWTPAVGWETGSLRFRPHGTHATLKPAHDPNCLMLWGVRQAKETGGSVLLAAAVTARLRHPSAAAAAREPTSATSGVNGTGGTGVTAVTPSAARAALAKAAPADAVPPSPATGEDHDALLRRLRELGALLRDGVLTEEEFTAAKRAVLDRF